MNNVLRVKILSPRKELFNASALSISSVNSAGPFDILANHGNFITLVSGNPINIVLTNQQTQAFAFPIAVIYARKNMVTIFTDIELEKLTD